MKIAVSTDERTHLVDLILAELQARTYHESQNKPIYVIREILQAAPVERARIGR